jgi:N-acetylglucosamine-6-sulfatase
MGYGVHGGAPHDEEQQRPGRGPPGGVRMLGPRAVLGVLLVAIVIALLAALPAEFSGPVRPSRPALGSGTAGIAAQPPNIIVVQVDDQDLASFTRSVMPHVFRLIADRGTTFTNYIDSGPLCCPSRAVLLTGQYGHNNGVMWNVPGYADLRDKDNTLPVWLQQAGYATAHIGKYLNLYSRATGDANEVAPGWDEWDSVIEPQKTDGRFGSLSYYNYTLRQNGQAVAYGSEPDDYVTRVLNDQAVRVIRRYVPAPRPLFMEVDQIAPHSTIERDPRCSGTAIPDPIDHDLFATEPLHTSPSFNEADVSDKPAYVRATPRLTAAEIANLRRHQNCRFASLAAVDRGVQRITAALAAANELGNTAIIYTSDNGFLLGAHRLHGKVSPYEEDLHVPFALRVPPRFAGPGGAPGRLASTVANVDVAPTILDLAGATPCNGSGNCRVLDGRSLLPALQSDGSSWPRDRGIPLELKSASGPGRTPCEYQGISTRREVLVEYRMMNLTTSTGPCSPDHEVESYDLRSDPFELQNQFPAAPGTPQARTQHELEIRSAKLSDCAGIEGRDPAPASGHYCE